MAKKKSKLILAQEATEAAIEKTNAKINELGLYTRDLYEALNRIQELFDVIRNVPSEKRFEYERLKQIRLNWKQQAEKIENDYNHAKDTALGNVAAGLGLGVAVAALGPTAAMGIATTFGVASTGTAIAALHGAAAVNAALAWLGGGAVAAGGGGIVAGKALLAMAGPVGWAIAGAAALSGGIMLIINHNEKKRLEDLFSLISERDKRSYDLATVELNERISRIKEETIKLIEASVRVDTFGQDYHEMTEAQQYELGSYVNLMSASTQLLVNPIKGLQPKFTDAHYDLFAKGNTRLIIENGVDKEVIIYLANLLYAIPYDDKDISLLIKCLKNNKEFRKSLNIKKKDINKSLFDMIQMALHYSVSW